MAIGEMEFYSKLLRRDVDFRFILPGDRAENMDLAYYNRPAKTLYLLHGYTKNSIEWMTCSNIATLAMRYNLTVIMPNGENAFYLDGLPSGRSYNTFVGEELVAYTRKLFGLSDKREDTFVAGESMGGFGAVMVGLSHSDTFSKIAAFSPAMIHHQVAEIKEDFDDFVGDYASFVLNFGAPEKLLQSKNNPEKLLLDLKREKREIPELFLCCGEEDDLLGVNRDFDAFLTAHELPHQYYEGHGKHDYDYWNQYVPQAVKWMIE